MKKRKESFRKHELRDEFGFCLEEEKLLLSELLQPHRFCLERLISSFSL